MRRILTLVAIVALALVSAIPALASGRPLTADLTGAAEAPGPGDPDGSGSAWVTLNQGLGEVCWNIEFEGIDEPFAAHIHEAPAGSPGPVVVGLNTSSGCADVDAQLIKEIRQNPSDYYVNVHNAAYPAGALRGQLSK